MHILKKKLNSCHNSSELLTVLRAIALYCVCFYGEKKNTVGVSWKGSGGVGGGRGSKADCWVWVVLAVPPLPGVAGKGLQNCCPHSLSLRSRLDTM